MVGVMIVMAVITAFAIFSGIRSSRQLDANEISTNALNTLPFDRTLAFRLAEEALKKDPKNVLANNVLNDMFYFYI